MNIANIGTQILKYRKQKGLTQEELGQRVGVSTQAVSRWECGGAPDVALLPAIADTLSVSIDALFGRECGPSDTGEERFKKRLASLSHKQMLNAVIDFLCSVELTREDTDISDVFNGFPARAKATFSNYSFHDVSFFSNDGFTYGICAKDFSFMTVFPEPEEGYANYFADNDSYRKLFNALSQPNVLEILTDISGEHCTLIMPAKEAQKHNITESDAKAAMEILAAVNIIDRVSIEQGNGIEYAYSFDMGRPIVPMLLFAAIVGQDTLAHFIMVNKRTTAILKKN